MPLSQRLIHTRVYGQAIVITVTAAVMMFAKSMESEGAYRMQGGLVVRQADLNSTQKLRRWYSDLGKEGDASGQTPALESAPPRKDGSGLDLVMPLIYVPLIPLVVVGLRGRVAPVRLPCVALAQHSTHSTNNSA